MVINIKARVQRLVERGGYRIWETSETIRECDPARTALVLCDVWDRHTCRGAEERLARLLPGIAMVVERFRSAGALIVHAPSDTIDFYEGTPARVRLLTVSSSVDASPRKTGPVRFLRCRSMRPTRATPVRTPTIPSIRKACHTRGHASMQRLGLTTRVMSCQPTGQSCGNTIQPAE